MLRGLSRVKELQNELAHARTIIEDLTTENRILKVIERRHEHALTKYESSHAELPMVIRSCSEELQSIQTRLRRSKLAFRQLEDRYRAQTEKLLTVQKKHKHLLDLTKNKQLGEREKLSAQLEEAENRIKQQEKKIQNLIRKMELEKKNYQHQLNVESAKTKALQMELSIAKELNERLESMADKLKFQSYVGKKSYVRQIPVNASGPKTQFKNSLSGGDRAPLLNGLCGMLTKPALVHGESDLSDHTKDLQKNLMRQVHEDVVNKPKMLVAKKNNSSESSCATSRLSYGISELIKKSEPSDAWSDDSIGGTRDGRVPAANPFSLSDKYGLMGKSRRLAVNKPVAGSYRGPTTTTGAVGRRSVCGRGRRANRSEDGDDDDNDNSGGGNDNDNVTVSDAVTFSGTDD